MTFNWLIGVGLIGNVHINETITCMRTERLHHIWCDAVMVYKFGKGSYFAVRERETEQRREMDVEEGEGEEIE